MIFTATSAIVLPGFVLVPLILALFDTTILSHTRKYKGMEHNILTLLIVQGIAKRYNNEFVNEVLQRLVNRSVDTPEPFIEAYSTDDALAFGNFLDDELRRTMNAEEKFRFDLIVKIQGLNNLDKKEGG